MGVRNDLFNMAKASSGFLRTNRFRVQIIAPPAMQTSFDRLNLTAYKFSIPGYTFEKFDRSNGGEVVHSFANSLQTSDINIGFYVGQDKEEYTIFSQWREAVADFESNRLGYKDDYATQIYADMLRSNTDETSLMEIELIDAWPSTVGDVDISFEDENQIAKLEVAFSIRNFNIT